MEKIKVQCPFCNEQMDAPADRTSIICMFCGKTITLSKEERDKEDDQHFSYLKEHFHELFEQVEFTMDQFNRTDYSTSFENFRKKNVVLLNHLSELLEYHVMRDEYFQELIQKIFHVTDSLLAEQKTRSKKDSMQLTINLFMVSYFLPSVLEQRTVYAKKFADDICIEWAKKYKNANIQAATYQSIQGGFKRKLCYVTTAVCQSLNKPLNCEELVLLKSYRDEVLLLQEDGKALVDEYYDIAPTILKRIERITNKDQFYEELYNEYLVQCVKYIKEKRFKECKLLYMSMVQKLKNDFFVTNRHD